jgi:hypothetical protein
LKSEREADANPSQQEVVIRPINDIITNVAEQSNVWGETVFQADATISQKFIVGIPAIQAMLISESSDPGEAVVFVK